ncbi:MAG TPA: GTPase Era [Longimicrobiales bacterium]
MTDASTKAGYVALVGRPNVGKSSLLNAMIGEKLSIVTARAQTTREKVLGIYTEAGVQIVFVDTPGLLEPAYALHKSMLAAAIEAVHDSDIVLLLLDATRPDEVPGGEPLQELMNRTASLFVVINKIDAGRPDDIKKLEDWTAETFGKQALPISAVEGTGLDELRALLSASLPESPFFYPEDDIAVQNLRFFAEELIRETIFERYDQEVPYGTVARVEEFKEDRSPVYIRATVYVERESQKPIIIGKQGAGIRGLGEAARAKIEQLLGSPVYLDLWVKPMPGWRNKPASLRYLGYAVPDKD